MGKGPLAIPYTITYTIPYSIYQLFPIPIPYPYIHVLYQLYTFPIPVPPIPAIPIPIPIPYTSYPIAHPYTYSSIILLYRPVPQRVGTTASHKGSYL